MRQAFFIILAFAAFSAHAEDDITGGIGALVDAGAPIAIGGIQADADKAIARINADAAVKMTQITSDTTKYLANDQGTVALYQAETAERVNNDNQRAVTERLAMQLAALSDARHEAERAEQQKLMVEQQYNNERIALAKQEADNTIALAKQQLALQVSISGLQGPSFGYSTSRLTLTNPNSPSGAVAQAAATPTPGPDGRGAVASDSSTDSSSDATASQPTPRAVGPRVAANAPKPHAVGPRSAKLPARLLASVGGSLAARGATIRSLGAQAKSGVRGAIVGNSVVRGSFPQTPVHAPASRGKGSVQGSSEARYAGTSHARGDARASTTVSTEEGEEAGPVAGLASNRHLRTDSAAD